MQTQLSLDRLWKGREHRLCLSCENGILWGKESFITQRWTSVVQMKPSMWKLSCRQQCESILILWNPMLIMGVYQVQRNRNKKHEPNFSTQLYPTYSSSWNSFRYFLGNKNRTTFSRWSWFWFLPGREEAVTHLLMKSKLGVHSTAPNLTKHKYISFCLFGSNTLIVIYES